MTIHRVKWTVSGESTVREADDANHAADLVEHAVERAAYPFVEDGAEAETQSFHYAREGDVLREDG